MPPNGKTLNLLSRFPDFYATGEATALYALAAALGDALEGAETDLIRVLRSHFVDTASNSSAHDPASAHRGDLDRLFALYLERLGGTSQLVQVSNLFQPRDLLELETLVTEIVRPKPDLGKDLKIVGDNQTPEHLTLLAHYAVDLADRQDSVHFTSATWLQPAAANLLTRLLIGNDPLLQYLKNRLSDATKTFLNRYTGTDEVPTDLLESFTADLNRLLPERAFTQAMQARYDYWTLGKALQDAWLDAHDRLTKAPASTFAIDNQSLPQSLARYLRRKLPLPVQKQILWRQIDPNLPKLTANDLPNLVADLQPEFNQLLPQSSVWQPLLTASQNPATVAPDHENMSLSPVMVTALLQAATQAMLRQVVSPDGKFPTVQAEALAQLARSTPATPQDRIRHNRLCLEASYPAEVPPSGIPTEATVRETLVTFLNQVVLPDPELYSRNQDFFKLLILDPETQSLIQAGKLDPPSRRRLNRLLLEAAFPTALQKSYVPYRERMRDLIQVLMRGASTQQGILDIVAANLGVFADSEAAQEARKTITIEEYQPVLESKTINASPSVREAAEGGNDTNAFSLTNPNVEPTAITLSLSLPQPPSGQENSLAGISQLTLFNADTQPPYFTYSGGLKAGDNLRLQADGYLFRNGAYIATMPPIVLPVGESWWYIMAHVGEWPGRLDKGQFDFSGFDQAEGTVQPMTAAQAEKYHFTVGYDLVRLTPGYFQVNVPWDIPGFTDRFDDNTDHPRRQIPSIISRVRAAGTHFAIAYTKTFRDCHDLYTHLTLIPAYRNPPELFDQLAAQYPNAPPRLVEHHTMADSNLDISSQQTPYGPDGIQHTMGDRLLTTVEGRPRLAGVFDYTEFDSGNALA